MTELGGLIRSSSSALTTWTRPWKTRSGAARQHRSGVNAGKRFIVADELYEPFLEKFTAAITRTSRRSYRHDAAGAAVVAAATDASSTAARPLLRAPGSPAGAARHGNFFHRRSDGHDRRQRRLPGGVFRSRRSVYRVGAEEKPSPGQRHPVRPRVVHHDRRPRAGSRVADHIEAGMVFINGDGAEVRSCRSVASKRSGFGRELGRFGADEFVNKKLIRVVA